jgi:tRNA A37 threonylcarbamoyladenosine biosynthesis protein TsaE
MPAKLRNNFQFSIFIFQFSSYLCIQNMITDELKYRIRSVFGHVPTEEQEHAIDVFTMFMTDRHEHAVMIMRGSAGTGKTTLAAAIVKTMQSLQQHIVLLAPTGRAAKVFSLYAGHPAYTIHRRIYRQKSLEGAFELNYNMAKDTLFIVDEASMIANASNYNDTPFANGQLLDDLIQFVYNGRNCRMLLIGDRAQLPPVGEEESPALMSEVLREYGLHVHECDLNEVLRQSQESGILYNATRIRSLTPSPSQGNLQLPQIRFAGFSDIKIVTGDELIESLASSYSKVGIDDTIVITRSNKRANIYNQGIRNMVLGREDEITTGDQLMIVKNNYYWSKESGEENLEDGLEFIANGDHAVVRKVRNVHEQYGFRFAEVTMTFPDYDDYELTTMVILDTLTSEAPALTREQQEQLYLKVMEDYADIPFKRDRLKKLREDKYYNALQIKFAYAATCHKAQGGQWAHVYIDQGYMTDDMLTSDYIHWLYTAFTRATDKLYLVNWSKTQTEE